MTREGKQHHHQQKVREKEKKKKATWLSLNRSCERLKSSQPSEGITLILDHFATLSCDLLLICLTRKVLLQLEKLLPSTFYPLKSRKERAKATRNKLMLHWKKELTLLRQDI